MKPKTEKNSAANEVQLELKYCERCGGLWLRPVGSGQIYCVGCGREVSQMPPASRQSERVRVPKGPQWGADGGEFEEDEEMDLDARGGEL
jgi:uncharacterized Zn finger protein (UPF0148 family)